jgi:hypothetical protein
MNNTFEKRDAASGWKAIHQQNNIICFDKSRKTTMKHPSKQQPFIWKIISLVFNARI